MEERSRIQFRQSWGKPLASKMASWAAQETQSKALRKSSLRTTAGAVCCITHCMARTLENSCPVACSQNSGEIKSNPSSTGSTTKQVVFHFIISSASLTTVHIFYFDRYIHNSTTERQQNKSRGGGCFADQQARHCMHMHRPLYLVSTCMLQKVGVKKAARIGALQ